MFTTRSIGAAAPALNFSAVPLGGSCVPEPSARTIRYLDALFDKQLLQRISEKSVSAKANGIKSFTNNASGSPLKDLLARHPLEGGTRRFAHQFARIEG